MCLQVFHGTRPVSNAQSIACRGPDFAMIGSAHGHVYGRGFYTTISMKTAASYAKRKGAICVCAAVLGNAKPDGRKEDTSDSLLQQNYHSVVAGDITVLFHPDSVHVQYIIHEVADATAERELAEKQQQLDAAWRDADLRRQKELQVTSLPWFLELLVLECPRYTTWQTLVQYPRNAGPIYASCIACNLGNIINAGVFT